MTEGGYFGFSPVWVHTRSWNMCCWACTLEFIFFQILVVHIRTYNCFRNFGVLKVLVKVFKSSSNLEMCYWIAFKLHQYILHHIWYSIPIISVKIVISLFNGCGLFYYLQFAAFQNALNMEMNNLIAVYSIPTISSEILYLNSHSLLTF